MLELIMLAYKTFKNLPQSKFSNDLICSFICLLPMHICEEKMCLRYYKIFHRQS